MHADLPVVVTAWWHPAVLAGAQARGLARDHSARGGSRSAGRPSFSAPQCLLPRLRYYRVRDL